MRVTTVQQLRQPHPDQDLIDARAAHLLRSSSRWTNGSAALPKKVEAPNRQAPPEPSKRA